MTDTPQRLPDPNARWFLPDGRIAPEVWQYFNQFDKTLRTITGIVDTPVDPLPTDLRNVYMEVACSDEVSVLTVGAAKVTFRLPFAMDTLELPRASLTTAQASGTLLEVDILADGVSIFSTPITLDNGSRTSLGAATPAVLSATSLLDDAEMTVDILQVGDGTATGLKIVMAGARAAP